MAVDGDEAYPVEMRLATCLLKEQTYLTTALRSGANFFNAVRQAVHCARYLSRRRNRSFSPSREPPRARVVKQGRCPQPAPKPTIVCIREQMNM